MHFIEEAPPAGKKSEPLLKNEWAGNKGTGGILHENIKDMT
jgi:hypothetical protein